MEETHSKNKEEIGSELIHYVNSLIEPLASDSTSFTNTYKNENESTLCLKLASKNEKYRSNQVWVVGVEAIDDLKDIIKLVKREIEGGPETERHAISLLIEWNTISLKLMPLWKISSDNIEIQSLIIQLLFLLTLPPDENWRNFNLKAMRCNAYIKNMQKVKYSLSYGCFWKGVLSLYTKLKKVVENKGFLEEDRDKLRKREEFILKLKEEDQGNDMNKNELSDDEKEVDVDFDVDIDKLIREGHVMKFKRLERLEIRRKIRDEIMLINEKVEKRNKLYMNRIGMIKGLIIQVLKINDPNPSESIFMFGIRSPHLILVSRMIVNGILEIIEDDSASFLTNKENIIRDESQLVAPWRILEYVYGLICNIQPIDLVNELFEKKIEKNNDEKLRNKLIDKIIKRSSSTGFTSNSLMNRHSRFNPDLARKRISKSRGFTSIQLNNSKYASANRIVKYRHGYDAEEMFEYIDILIGPMQSTGGNIHDLHMYGFNTIEGTLENIDGMNKVNHQETIQLLGAFLDNFFKTKLPCLFERIFLILRNGSEKHTIWDLSRLISLMTWFLSYKREIFYQVTKEESDVNVINDELTRLVLEIKILIDTSQNTAIDFIHSTIKHHTRETLMRNKSHKIVRTSLRCLNEQLKIIHIMSNSNLDKLSGLGMSIISFMAKLDLMNDLSWILKHYVKTTHHPELILYSIEVSNRLIKLISKIGGNAVVNIRRRRKDRLTGESDFINYDDDNEEIYLNDKQKLPGFNECNYSEKVKLMSLEEMMNDFCDGRIVSAIMNIVNNYSTNHSNINWHVSRLARKIITTRPIGINNKFNDIEVETENKYTYIYSGLFFQLTYFITFANILSDKGFISSSETDKGAEDVISLARHVVHQFWEVAKINKFVFIELLFSKNSARGLGLADPERLRSIFTNYEEGMDFEIINRMENTGSNPHEAKLYIKSKISKEKNSKISWSEKEDEELLSLYSQFEENPKCISIITGLLSDIKTERSVKKRLKELGKLKDFEANDKYDSDLKNKNIDVVSSIIDFKEINIDEYVFDEHLKLDLDEILNEQSNILEEAYSTRELMIDDLIDIPLESPSSIPNSLISDSKYTSILKSLGLKQFENKEDSIWMVPKELSQNEYLKMINTYKELIVLDLFDLHQMFKHISEDNKINSRSDNYRHDIKYSDNLLKETIIEIFEDSKLYVDFPKINLDDEIPNENGLFHFLCYELKTILDKNKNDEYQDAEYNGDWENTESESLTLCLSKERFEYLGIKKELINVFESDQISKLLKILGFKKKLISKDTQFIINIDRGINRDLHKGKEDNLFDDDDYLNNNVDFCDEFIECWTFDCENISLAELNNRYNILLNTIISLKINENKIINNSNKNTNFSKKFILELSGNIYKLRKKLGKIDCINTIIDKFKEIISDDRIMETKTNDTFNIFCLNSKGEYDHFDFENKYFKRLAKTLFGKQVFTNGLSGYTFSDLFEKYSIDKINELIELMNKLKSMDLSQLATFIDLAIDEKKHNVEGGRKTNETEIKKIKIDTSNKENQHMSDDYLCFDSSNEFGNNKIKETDKNKSMTEFPDELFASD
ncbi:SANT domain containing protein [Cryptosporidium ryanae]|uniref:SANT domain containing protein n=1 Tax=Cryptosporidium ryanae TaxID=515981 RepID=UPI00351A4982|nr:SANT domain containing protein [Cryptosporidium ryanae]